MPGERRERTRGLWEWDPVRSRSRPDPSPVPPRPFPGPSPALPRSRPGPAPVPPRPFPGPGSGEVLAAEPMGGRDMARPAGGADPHRAEVAGPAAHPASPGRGPRSHGALAGCHHRQVKPLAARGRGQRPGEEVPARRGACRTDARGVRRGSGAVSWLGPPCGEGVWGLGVTYGPASAVCTAAAVGCVSEVLGRGRRWVLPSCWARCCWISGSGGMHLVGSTQSAFV